MSERVIATGYCVVAHLRGSSDGNDEGGDARATEVEKTYASPSLLSDALTSGIVRPDV